MKVKAVYRDLKDKGKNDFMAKLIEWDVGDDVPWKDVETMVKAAAPPGFEFESVELL